jgi:hypothetical protein
LKVYKELCDQLNYDACTAQDRLFREKFIKPASLALDDSVSLLSNCEGNCGPEGESFCNLPGGEATSERFYCIPDFSGAKCKMQVAALPCRDGEVCRSVGRSSYTWGVCQSPHSARGETMGSFGMRRGPLRAALTISEESCPGDCWPIGLTWCGDAQLNGKPYTDRWTCAAVLENGQCRRHAVPIPCGQQACKNNGAFPGRAECQ